MQSYKAYWTSTILRYLVAELRRAKATVESKNNAAAGGERVVMRVTPAELARAVHLRREDMEVTMRDLGLVREVDVEVKRTGGDVVGTGGMAGAEVLESTKEKDGSSGDGAAGQVDGTAATRTTTAAAGSTAMADAKADVASSAISPAGVGEAGVAGEASGAQRVFAIHLERVEALYKQHKVWDKGLLMEEYVRL
jgi:hypothetical protein